jgi:dTDP-4-amino-4,6-dideoxygalactose transaminase
MPVRPEPPDIPFQDLVTHHQPIQQELEAAVLRVMSSGSFILGTEVAGFEKEAALALGATHAVGLSSGTDALLATLMALGIGRGDEVVTTPFSFFASAGVIERVGAIPVFADIHPETLNLDGDAAVARIGRHTKAVLAVHLFGRVARFPNLEEVLASDQIPLGAKPKYHHPAVGGNFRLDEIQAAVLRVKLPHLFYWSERRRQIAARYRAALFGTPIGLPPEDPGSVWSQFVIRVSDGRRDALASHLKSKRIATAIYYPEPLHLQPCFAHLGYRPGHFPHAERACSEVLALPIYPELGEEAIDRVVDAIRSFF